MLHVHRNLRVLFIGGIVGMLLGDYIHHKGWTLLTYTQVLAHTSHMHVHFASRYLQLTKRSNISIQVL